MSDCPFCPLEHKTDWYYYYHGSQLIVCRDLDDKDYKYRLLVVLSGKEYHKARWENIKEKLIGVGVGVANAHIANGWATKIAKIDTEHMKYPEHYHIQVCML